MSALAQPTRFEVFRLLVRAGEGGVSSGDLATKAGAAPNTMSAHLAILNRAGLVTAEKTGRYIVYYAVPAGVQHLAEYLLDEFCKPTTGPNDSEAGSEKDLAEMARS